MPSVPVGGVFADGDLFVMSLFSWGAFSPRTARDSRQQADHNSASTHWWLMHAFFLSALIVALVMCLGVFEYVRFSTFILETTCFIQSHEIVELGACSVCKGRSCSLYPKAMAKVLVTFHPLHWKHNVTGTVSHCNIQEMNICLHGSDVSNRYISGMGGFRWQNWIKPYSPVPWGIQDDDGGKCDLSKVYQYMQGIRAQPSRKCYYNSREPGGGQVWFSKQSPVQRGALEVMNQQGVPLLCVFCGASLFLATLLGCLSIVD